ncbi:aldo/keto reductase [Sphingobacterium arenae]|uniref:Aldo/keto reductase n=1 Tax=Sphingobacterium arenae TaxID=1280598 RepID=A0ABR7XY39_9SPHI|nr:aldo/keto reductase [Sphingobacterium arenae]MBD1423965.1 aldo/keto reductase [Sphingobacterium arenae]
MLEQNRIGLGMASIGRPRYINIKQDESNEVFSLENFKEKGKVAIENAYKNGIRHFDTSPGYGIAESLLIDWLKEKNDPAITISTKWGYTYVADFDPNATEHEVKEHSIDKLIEQWMVSRKLLPYLKIYQIHSATLESGVLENSEVLSRLHSIKKSHKIHIGLSTTGDNQVEVLQKAMDIFIDGEQLFQSFQCTFNILEQSIKKIKNKLDHLDGRLIIKEAMANGRLIPNKQYLGYNVLYAFMNTLAAKYHVGIDAIAMQYCMESFPTALVLSGTNDNNHLVSNLKANQFQLSSSETKQLSAFGIESSAYWKERKRLQWN